MQPSRDVADLLKIMSRLRDPQAGCPWDLKQTFSTIAPYTLEEAYEVADAAERGDMPALKDELGDLLLQVAFFAQMAKEKHAFDFADVTEAITTKLIRRHPHIFADASAASAEEVKTLWDKIKRSEKPKDQASLLDEVPAGMPALQRAVKLQEKAGSVGFDWNDPQAVIAKIREELTELEEALKAGDKPHEKEELGDLLFAFANLARHLKIDPEQALRQANGKFTRRFAAIEKALQAAGRSPKDASLDEMENLWMKAKQAEKNLLLEP